MDDIKIKNFIKDLHCDRFPKYEKIEEKECMTLYVNILNKFNIDNTKDKLVAVKKISNKLCLLNSMNAKDDKFNFFELLKRLDINVDRNIYINWGCFDDIDKININDFSKYFSYIWYPDVDDIDVFDDTLTWYISIFHDGYIGYYKGD